MFDAEPRTALEQQFEGMVAIYQPYMNDMRRFDTTRADVVLDKAGVVCPEVDYPLFKRCMDYAVEAIGPIRWSVYEGYISCRPFIILRQRFADNRSGKVIFLSHCLLNENARYMGGAFCAGVNPDALALVTKLDAGVIQMPCPERLSWGEFTRSIFTSSTA